MRSIVAWLTLSAFVAVSGTVAGCGAGRMWPDDPPAASGGELFSEETPATPPRSPPVAATRPPPAPEPPQDRLQIGALRVFRGSEFGAQIASDGTVQIDSRHGWITLGRFQRDGSFMGAHGQLLATLMPDGQIRLPDGRSLVFTIHPDGTMVDARTGTTLRIGDDGALLGGQRAPEFRVESAETIGFQREAMLLFAILGTPALVAEAEQPRH